MEIMVNWISQTGWKIFLVLGICLGTFMMIRRFVPLAIRRTVRRQMKRKRKVEREKRVQTLVRLVTTSSAIGLGILAAFLILQQIGINMTAPLVGLGVFGIAVGFGAQYLIRDIIAGFFI